MEKILDIAKLNTEEMRRAPYSGRTLILGETSDKKHYVQVYWTVGRSKSSQNRIMLKDGENVKTEPAVIEENMVRPELLIYNVARVIDEKHIVTNGSQTDNIFNAIKNGKNFEDAINEVNFEHDGPIYTPRISGMIDLNSEKELFKIGINKSLNKNPEYEIRHIFSYNKVVPGTGFCIHTYDFAEECGTFNGEPFPVLIFDSIEETSDFYWNLIPCEKRVAMYVKFINKVDKTIEEVIRNEDRDHTL